VSNARLMGMSLLQALVVGVVGYGLGVGGAALFGIGMTAAAKSVPPAFYMTWQILVGSGVAVLAIVLLASVVSIRRVLVLEPAVVFK
jgi:putative ABC transport system permease protein